MEDCRFLRTNLLFIKPVLGFQFLDGAIFQPALDGFFGNLAHAGALLGGQAVFLGCELFLQEGPVVRAVDGQDGFIDAERLDFAGGQCREMAG